MACAVSRELRDGELGFVCVGTGRCSFIHGAGIPSVGVALAQHRGIDFIAQYSVKLELIISDAPESFSDADLIEWPCKAQIPVEDSLDILRRGMVDWGFVTGSQVDPYGNLNSVSIGNHDRPTVRFAGSISQADICACAKQTIVVIPHDKGVFVEKVDFISGLGFGDGRGCREKYQHRGKGPSKVITDLAVIAFSPETKRMYLESLHPGVTREQVQSNTGFPLEISARVATTMEPTKEEIDLIREKIDTKGVWLRGQAR